MMKQRMDNWLKYWNDRYQKEPYAYGTAPNEYLKTQLAKFSPGSILFGADGEGRNSVFAARQGWEVSAFDISAEGRKKALQLAQQQDVTIDYQVGELPTLNYSPGQFDAVALIYAHFPPSLRHEYLRLLDRYLRPGGVVILEGFSKNHLEYKSRNPAIGGPGDIDSLFSIEEITTAFPQYDALELAETLVTLEEGLHHNGTGSVIRFTGRKK